MDHWYKWSTIAYLLQCQPRQIEISLQLSHLRHCNWAEDLHEFCKYKPLLYAVKIFQPSAAAPAHYIVRKRTPEEKKMSCVQYKASFSRVRIMINILRHVRPGHCAQRDHRCPRDLESHLNKRRVPLPPPVIWDDKDETWWRRLFSTWFVAREWVGVDQMREEFHLYH